MADTTLNLNSVEYRLEMSKGNITDHEIVGFVGTSDGAPSNNEKTLWDLDQIMTPLTSPQTLYVSSTNSGDGQTIIVEGLDGDYNPITGKAVLNGQNQVEIVDFTTGNPITFLRVFGAPGNFLGSTNLLGDVYVAESDTLSGGVPNDDTKIKAHIVAKNNVGRNGFFTVKAGYTAYLTKVTLTGRKNDEFDVDFLVRTPGGVELRPSRTNGYQNVIDLFDPYVKFTEKTDFEVRLTPRTVNTSITFFGQFILVKN